MNNCEQCKKEGCIDSGVNTPAGNCKSFDLRDLTKFEKSIIRHGLICGLFMGFFLGLSLFLGLHLGGFIP